MKILIASQDFSTISGAPMWCFELARVLRSRGHDVWIAAQHVGGIMRQKARDHGIATGTFSTPWGNNFDILHVTAVAPSHWAINTFPDVPAVLTCHSTLTYETPMIHNRIRAYVGVRPQVVDRLVDHDHIPRSSTRMIWNGVDRTRFYPAATAPEGREILFVGTVDYLRAQATGLANDWAALHGYTVRYIGREMSGQLLERPSHVVYDRQDDVWHVEEYLRAASMTAGILLGRTTIEGWMCGLPGLCYEIDNDGNVTSWGVYEPPHPEILRQFDIETMADEYLKLYESII